ncbi:MAG: hypothetical protein GVY19_02295 [Bacteroidetes bacterium]|jgi:hypothetical protein|nr:hypothetical protein [Bacteroidota bacterium]
MKTKKNNSGLLKIITLVVIMVTSAMTYANGGKITFSDSFGEFSKNTQKTFEVGDELYMQTTLPGTLEDIYNKHNYAYDFSDATYTYNYGLRVYVDGKLDGQFLVEMPKNDFDSKTVVRHALASEKEDVTQQHFPLIMQWMELLKQYEEGMHTIKLEFVPIYPDIAQKELPVVASGTFKFKLDKNELMAYEDRKTSDLPPSTIESQQIEDRIVDASSELYTGAFPIDAVITDMEGDWTYFTDDNGNITHRNLIATVAYYWTAEDKCTLKSARYYEKHQGHGAFGPLLFYKEVEGYYDYEVPCDEVTTADLSKKENY